MATKVEFSIKNEDHEAFLRKYQEILQGRQPAEGGEKITLSDAALSIFSQGVSRVKATSKYAKEHKPEPKPRKAKAPKAAKPAKKSTGAKGPLARKTASKAKAPKVRKARVPAVVSDAPASAPVAAAAPVLD